MERTIIEATAQPLAEGPLRALPVWRLAIAYRLHGKLAITAKLRSPPLFVHERVSVWIPGRLAALGTELLKRLKLRFGRRSSCYVNPLHLHGQIIRKSRSERKSINVEW